LSKSENLVWLSCKFVLVNETASSLYRAEILLGIYMFYYSCANAVHLYPGRYKFQSTSRSTYCIDSMHEELTDNPVSI
jgi:hypothetical protein